MLNPRTRYGLSALVCVSTAILVFMATATRYNPTFEGDRIETLVAELSREIGRPVRGGLEVSEQKLVLNLRYTPEDSRYLDAGGCRRQMKDIMELAAIHYTGFADEISVRAEPAESVPLIGDLPAVRRFSESVAELRRRFDRKQILASGDKIWRLGEGVGYAAWKYVVVHHSGGVRGSAEAFDRYHREGRGWESLGYHFVIGNGNGSRDGQIEAGGRWTAQRVGAHTRSKGNKYNIEGIGICLVGDFASDAEMTKGKQKRLHPGHGAPPTRKQMESLRFLVLYLALKRGISSQNILVHRDVGQTICPGEYFPKGDFIDDVRRHLARLKLAE